MPDAIEHLMWGYQDAFRFGGEWHARNLFQSLDSRFDPEVFLIGALIEQRPGRYPACVDPEEGHWIDSDAFSGVVQRATQILQTYEESKILPAQPAAEQRHIDGLIKRGIRDAISETIAACETRPEGMRYFVSWPVLVDGYLVSVVLGLQQDVIDAHPQLTISRLQSNPTRSIKVAVSLIDAVADEYFHFVCGELLKPEPGGTLLSGKGTDEILRAAGQRLMVGVAQRADTRDHQQGDEASLFDACNSIAATQYEQADGKGRLILARRDHPSLTDVVVFENPMPVRNGRGARKLLELASGSLALHHNARDIWGLARLEGYAVDAEDLFEIRIIDHHRWELVHADMNLMHVRNGIPSLPRPTLDAARLRIDLVRIFRGIAPRVVEHIVALAQTAARERHGTMLVISAQAAQEALRLKNQSFRLTPCPITPQLLAQLTPIDGAVLLDVDGICHAIGVILDGLATTAGTSSRGARFNSALRYVTTRPEPCMAIVFSVDGGVDILPNLRPPIRRSEIETRLAALQHAVQSGALHPAHHARAVQWLVENQFYLLPEHCATFNQIIALLEGQLEESPSPVSPCEDMDPALYYLDE